MRATVGYFPATGKLDLAQNDMSLYSGRMAEPNGRFVHRMEFRPDAVNPNAVNNRSFGKVVRCVQGFTPAFAG